MSDYMRTVRSKLGSQLLEIPSVSVLTFDERDRVVLVRHAEFDLWTTPGGAVEPEEVPADAAVREMWEETGLHVELQRVIGVYGGPEFTTTYRNGDAVSFMMTVFQARRIGGCLRPDDEETLEVGSFAQDEVAELAMQHWAPRVVMRAFADRLRGGDPPSSGPYFDPPTWAPLAD